MVDESTIYPLPCYIDMKDEKMTYGGPNMGCLLGTAYQAEVRRLTRRLAETELGISVPEYTILRALFEKDGMQQCEIGDIIGKDKGAVCRCVKMLEKKGLVKTEPISHKCLRVFLSGKGRELKPAVMALAEESQKNIETILGTSGAAALKAALIKIIEQ